MRIVRDATVGDAATCAAVYAPYVTGTAVSFESEPPSTAAMAGRISASLATHAWVVLEDDGDLTGYAYAGPFQGRPAYRWSCEVSVYLARGRGRSGGGRALYEALFDRLAARGYRTAVAVMTMPNEASSGFHRAMGFADVGIFRRVGWKDGEWRDVAWVRRDIGPGPVSPPAELL